MRLDSFSPLLTEMMTDEMDVYRHTEVQNSDGTTSTILPTSPLHTQIKCRVSFSSLDNPRESEIDQTPIKVVPKIFCSTLADIKTGDMIVVRRLRHDKSTMVTYRGQIGLPANYLTHKEALFFIKESA